MKRLCTQFRWGVFVLTLGLTSVGLAVTSTYNVDSGGTINDPGTLTTFFTVGAAPTSLLDVNLRLALVHPVIEDIDVILTSPSGTSSVLLIDALVSNGANFQDTLLDDSASMSITFGTAPFIGSYQPINPLSAFIGENPNGNWTLDVSDDLVLSGEGTLLAAGDVAPWDGLIGTQLIIESEDRTPVNGIPEPLSAVLGLTGLAAIGISVRRRRI